MAFRPGLHYDPRFLDPADRVEILAWLKTLHPIWEQRFSANHPPPAGQTQRPLLRPVYWLGNWQFACLGYYRPPRGTKNRCVEAEPFPPVLRRLVGRVEKLVHQRFPRGYVPRGWKLNTCLINLYGDRTDLDKPIDTARVGEHKDFEPGPVASLSLGERALFQFVESRGKQHRSEVMLQQWLEDGSLQVFAGDYWKDRLFHRVQRVEDRAGHSFDLSVNGFDTRRINFTFRYVPETDIIPFRNLPSTDADDVRGYVEELAAHSAFFAKAVKGPSHAVAR